MKFKGYECSLCHKTYETDPGYICPEDGGNLNIILDYKQIKKDFQPDDIFSSRDISLWRYLPLLPVEEIPEGNTPFHNAGFTPLFQVNSLAGDLGLNRLWIKDEGRNPTASLKDRASCVVLARAREIMAETVVTASTGNAGAALAGMAAAINQKAIIFAPKTAPPAKIAQLLVFNAEVILVDGTYDDAFDLSTQSAEVYGWYCRNTGTNPFTVEGKKTAAFEIWEQLLVKHPDLQKPLNIFVSVGDGNIISGIHKGFKDLMALGWIDSMPRIFGVQSEGSAAIANTFHRKSEEIIPVKANTVADSISVDLPRDGVRAVRAARETGGSYIIVSDEEIIHSIVEIGKTGVFAEPAGAAAYAGLKKAVIEKMIKPDDPVLVINTGSGLKDVRSAMKSVQDAVIIEPSMQALQNYIK